MLLLVFWGQSQWECRSCLVVCFVLLPRSNWMDVESDIVSVYWFYVFLQQFFLPQAFRLVQASMHTYHLHHFPHRVWVVAHWNFPETLPILKQNVCWFCHSHVFLPKAVNIHWIWVKGKSLDGLDIASLDVWCKYLQSPPLATSTVEVSFLRAGPCYFATTQWFGQNLSKYFNVICATSNNNMRNCLSSRSGLVHHAKVEKGCSSFW